MLASVIDGEIGKANVPYAYIWNTQNNDIEKYIERREKKIVKDGMLIGFGFFKLSCDGDIQIQCESQICDLKSGTYYLPLFCAMFTSFYLVNKTNRNVEIETLYLTKELTKDIATSCISTVIIINELTKDNIPVIFSNGCAGCIDISEKQGKTMIWKSQKTQRYIRDDTKYEFYLYSSLVEVIRERNEFQNMCSNYSKDMVLFSNPPCIIVTCEVSKFNDLKEWLHKEYPDSKLSNPDFIKVIDKNYDTSVDMIEDAKTLVEVFNRLEELNFIKSY